MPTEGLERGGGMRIATQIRAAFLDCNQEQAINTAKKLLSIIGLDKKWFTYGLMAMV
jgi:hypothetical protein